MSLKLCFAAALMGCALLTPSASAFAAGADYEFQPVSVEVKAAPGAGIAVRLVHKPTGKPVADAVIFRTRLDMSPDAMGDMTAKVAPQPSSEPGVYKFKADLSMAGGWALKLMAKVPGESDTVEGTAVFRAK